MLANFNFPNRGAAEAFAKAQVILYQASPVFQHYFYSLQKHVSFCPNSPVEDLTPQDSMTGVAIRGVQKLAAALPRPGYRVDVVVCGIWLWARRQEDELMAVLLQRLLEQDATVLCLLHQGTSSAVRRRLQESADASVLNRLRFLDPAGRLGRLDVRFQWGAARQKARADFNQAQQLLAPHGIHIDVAALPEFEWAAARLMEWEVWAPLVEFETALVRCHWLPLCSAVAATALQRQKKLVTLQQGVVGHSLDIPVLAHQYLCFGGSSEQILKEMDATFAQATGWRPVCHDYVPVGSLFDPILNLSHNFSQKTVLILDQSTRWANHLYGLAEQTAALIRLVTLLCQQSQGLHKVVIRPHPAANDIGHWQQLANQFPQRCEISPAAQSLSADLGRAAIAVSLFSGAAVVAAASGLPSFFLKTANGYFTQDLACCEPQFLTVEELLPIIEQLCTHEAEYQRWQQRCRQNASAYYANNQMCQFEPELMQTILAPRSRP